jgi:alpha-galactosidase
MQKLLSAALLVISLPLAARSSHAAAKGISPDNPTVAPLESRIGAEVNGVWLYSTGYPSQQKSEEPFRDNLGEGTLITIHYSGISGSPSLLWRRKSYRGHAFTTSMVQVENSTSQEIQVSRIRLFEGDGKSVAALGGDLAATRVLSDSYSEDTPVVRIRDFNDMPYGVHLAVSSQLLYNPQSGKNLFAGALTAKRWLTIFRLKTDSFTIDDEGTTALTAHKSLSPSRPHDYVTLQVAVPPGGHLDSEELLISAGQDYLSQMRDYGEAVKAVNNARVTATAPWGWWSFTAFYLGLSDGLTTTNAMWLAQHLASYGYNYLHMDEGYSYTRGDYTTPDPRRFPNDMVRFGRTVTSKGLTLGVWTAPFEVSDRSWIYLHHQDWLVRNPQGEPISLGKQKNIQNIYALDPTHPGAQAYLRETYQTFTRLWGVGYIKMDFMEMSSVEGTHYRPNTSALEAERIGLGIIRDAVGDDVILDKDGSSMLAPVGLVDAGRLSNDTEHSFQGTFDAATGIAARFYMNRNFYVADPDVFCVSNERSPDPTWDELKPISLEEAKAAISLSAMAGGMFEVGDDLPALGKEPERLALLTNPELLKLMRLSHSSTPLDLMSYAKEDLQPSLFWIRESDRQGLLAIFNWSESDRSHEIPLDRLGLSGHTWKADEIFAAGGVAMHGHAVTAAQPAHSVRLIRLTNEAVPATAPALSIEAEAHQQIGKEVRLQASSPSQGNPLLRYTWDFGDGTTMEGKPAVAHTYTHKGSFTATLRAESMDGPVSTASHVIEIDGELKTRFDPGESPSK